MASSSDQDVILLSIEPRYAQAIMDGSKRVELRRNGIPQSVRYVVVYESSPTQRVTGYFEVERTDSASPTALWRKYGRAAAVTRSFFRAYFRGVARGTALLIRRAWRLRRPVRLETFSVQPPQSFRYVPSRMWSRVKRRKVNVVTRARHRETEHRSQLVTRRSSHDG